MAGRGKEAAGRSAAPVPASHGFGSQLAASNEEFLRQYSHITEDVTPLPLGDETDFDAETWLVTPSVSRSNTSALTRSNTQTSRQLSRQGTQERKPGRSSQPQPASRGGATPTSSLAAPRQRAPLPVYVSSKQQAPSSITAASATTPISSRTSRQQPPTHAATTTAHRPPGRRSTPGSTTPQVLLNSHALGRTTASANGLSPPSTSRASSQRTQTACSTSSAGQSRPASSHSSVGTASGDSRIPPAPASNGGGSKQQGRASTSASATLARSATANGMQRAPKLQGAAESSAAPNYVRAQSLIERLIAERDTATAQPVAPSFPANFKPPVVRIGFGGDSPSPSFSGQAKPSTQQHGQQQPPQRPAWVPAKSASSAALESPPSPRSPLSKRTHTPHDTPLQQPHPRPAARPATDTAGAVARSKPVADLHSKMPPTGALRKSAVPVAQQAATAAAKVAAQLGPPSHHRSMALRIEACTTCALLVLELADVAVACVEGVKAEGSSAQPSDIVLQLEQKQQVTDANQGRPAAGAVQAPPSSSPGCCVVM